MFKKSSVESQVELIPSKILGLLRKLMILITLVWLLVSCRSNAPHLSIPSVSLGSVDIAPDGSYLLIGGFLTERATPDPSDKQPYSQLPNRLWRYEMNTHNLKMLQFPLSDVTGAQISVSGYLAFYGEEKPYQFILDGIWFTTDMETMSPVELDVPAGVVYWTWYPGKDLLLLGVQKSDGEFSIDLYDPVANRIVQSDWYSGKGQLGEFDLSRDENLLALAVDEDICILDLQTNLLSCQNDSAYEAEPTWSPSASKFVRARCQGGRCSLIVSTPDRRCEYEIERSSSRGGIAWESESVLWVASGELYRLDLGGVLGDRLQEDGDLTCSQ